MQRSISDKKPVALFFAIVAYIVYSSLGSIYPLLPPLLALLFVFYKKAMQKEDMLFVILISFALLVFEANYGFVLFSSLIYFYLLLKIVIPKLEQNISCTVCIKILTVIFVYLGYFLFSLLIAKIFMLDAPTFNYYIIYYIVVELLIVSLL